MRPSLVAAFTAVLLALPLAPSAVADEGADKADPSVPSQDAQAQAEEALDQAEALLSDDSGARKGAAATEATETVDVTMALRELMLARDDLAPADRKRANALLARPTDGNADSEGDGYEVDEEEPLCGAVVCVHYVASTSDAPPPADNDSSGVPDAVEHALATAESVNDTYTSSGYRRPDPDGSLGNHGDTTNNDKMDVYLADIGDKRYYGYCTSDQPDKSDGTWNYWAYCVIDNDFRPGQFPTNTPTENRQVTLAHEYFHAIQFAYDLGEDPWFLEATATWAEDELYDGVNDNRQYLPLGQLKHPEYPLDEFAGLQPYGEWVFFRYLTERWAGTNGSLPRIVLQMWRAASGRDGAPDLYSTQAIQRVLGWRHAPFANVYGQFAGANRTPARSYEEGRHYPRARPDRHYKLGTGHRRTGRHRTLDMDHLTSYTVRLKPRRSLRRLDWTVRVNVDAPPRRTAPAARLVISRKNGRVLHRNIRLNAKGVGRQVVAFSSRKVRYVELVVANASRRMSCWSNSNLACMGNPLDDFRHTSFHARVFRR